MSEGRRGGIIEPCLPQISQVPPTDENSRRHLWRLWTTLSMHCHHRPTWGMQRCQGYVFPVGSQYLPYFGQHFLCAADTCTVADISVRLEPILERHGHRVKYGGPQCGPQLLHQRSAPIRKVSLTLFQVMGDRAEVALSQVPVAQPLPSHIPPFLMEILQICRLIFQINRPSRG